MRLDKYLSVSNVGSRSEIKKDIKNGLVTVNDDIIKAVNYNIDYEIDVIYYKNKKVIYEEFSYYILNKPADYVCAKKDNLHKTVMELLDVDGRENLFPVGRLDIDTEGLLLLTNDGQLSHDLLSPNKHVDKKYFARIKGIVTQIEIDKFSNGLKLSDFTTKSSKLEIINYINKDETEVFITISEGKFHQIKRMFHAVGMEVLYLKRVAMGKLILPEDLEKGQYIKITKEDILN